jgi:hypothetical protein
MSDTEKFPEPVEQLAAMSNVIIRRYKELVMEGPLSAYFTVVRGGMMDAAQALTDQVEASVASFQDKILELVAESEYFKTADRLITDMKVASEAFKGIMASMDSVPQPVAQGKAESGTPE